MNREIKFRAWDKEHKKMIVGNNASHTLAIASAYDFIIMQYTGLKDKSGVEIYEGDIIFDMKRICVIKFNKCSFYCSEGLDIKEPDNNWTSLYSFSLYVYFKVIGNIYEHEELVNGKQGGKK